MFEKELKKIAYNNAVAWYMQHGYTEKKAIAMANWTIYKK